MFEFTKKIHDQLYTITTQGNIHKTIFFSLNFIYIFLCKPKKKKNSTQSTTTPHHNFPNQSKRKIIFYFLRCIYSTQFKSIMNQYNYITSV